jgi:hypothetical protein
MTHDLKGQKFGRLTVVEKKGKLVVELLGCADVIAEKKLRYQVINYCTKKKEQKAVDVTEVM